MTTKPIDKHEPSDKHAVLEALERLLAELRVPRNKRMTFADILEQHPLAAPYVFSGRDLRNITFDSADLRGVDTYGSDLDRCSFRNAQIAGAGFDMAKVSRAQLRQASDWMSYLRDHEWRPPRRRSRRFPGDRFSCAPWLSELMILPPRLIEKESDDLRLKEDERRALIAGELAIALKPVNGLEFRSALSDERSGSDMPVTLTRTQARGYVEALNRLVFEAPGENAPSAPFQKVAVPSMELLQMLAALAPSGPAAENATTLEPGCLNVACPTDTGHPVWEYVSDEDFALSAFAYANNRRRRAGAAFVEQGESAYLRPLYFFEFDEGRQ